MAQAPTATRSKSQARKTGTTARAGASAGQQHAGLNNVQQPYFSYSHVPREARIVPNKTQLGFSVQIRETTGEYGGLGQWKNADSMPLWALKPLLEQCGVLRGGFSSNAVPATITQQADGAASIDVADKVTGSSA